MFFNLTPLIPLCILERGEEVILKGRSPFKLPGSGEFKRGEASLILLMEGQRVRGC
jgi:hypothetical protein